ncbi:hypothetical protein C3E80_22235, partial [Cronobacter malonaticus]
MRNTFGRQAIPMVWDFAEANIIAEGTGSFASGINQGYKVLKQGLPAINKCIVKQFDAQSQNLSTNKVISTDPPYYD